MVNLRINEVFNTVTVAKRRFDYVEYLKPFIQHIEIQVAESPQITTQYSSQILYRMFKENTLSRMTYEQWTNNCILCISPQQLGLPNFSENLSVVTAINLTLTMAPSPIAKRLLQNWDALNYTGTCSSVDNQVPEAQDNSEAEAPAKPEYQVRAHFDYSNRSLLINSRREMVIKKNARKFNGLDGLSVIKA